MFGDCVGYTWCDRTQKCERMSGYWVGESKASWHTRGTDGADYFVGNRGSGTNEESHG